MGKIYGSFAELAREHRGVFDALESRGVGLDVPRAVWDVRQPEVERLEDALRRSEALVRGLRNDVARLEEGNRRFATEVADKDVRIEELDRLAADLADEARGLRERARELRGELAGRDAAVGDLESSRGRAAAERDRLAREGSALKERAERLAEELRLQREAALRIAEESRAKDARAEELAALLAKERAYSKQYRQINNRMSVEMDRMGREVEALRSAVH